jgi:Protein of unknown function (DUF3105)
MGKKARLATRQRVAEMREEQARADRRRRIFIVAGCLLGVIVVAAGIALVVVTTRENDKKPGPKEVAGVQTFQEEQGHTNSAVTYPQTPPAGGQHNPVWQNCGIYDKPLQNENAVHSMEHGAVWITYRPDLPSDGVEKLREAVGDVDYTLLSPFPNLPAPVVASAWGKQLKLTGPDDPRLKQFLRAYVRGPQTPEPGAPCTGGTGQPVQ